jgi:hypothetical protein
VIAWFRRLRAARRYGAHHTDGWLRIAQVPRGWTPLADWTRAALVALVREDVAAARDAYQSNQITQLAATIGRSEDKIRRFWTATPTPTYRLASTTA